VQILLIRHAIADDRARFAQSGRSDTERPLTTAGKKRMRKGCRGLREAVGRPDLIATSPLVRAAETAQLVADAYRGPAPAELAPLAPDGAPDEVVAYLREHAVPRVALVGHAPDLDRLAGYLVTGQPREVVALKKGGACLLELDRPAAGHARLCWVLTPKQLRRLGARS
jgi:phosphohistidine phosphatase